MKVPIMEALQLNRRSPLLTLTRMPSAATILSRMIVAALAVTTLFLVLAPWQQTAAGSGRVVAYAPTERQQQLEAPVDGRIVRWWVQEGSRVKEGDPIVEITDVDPLLLDRLGQEREAVRDRLRAATDRAESDQARMDALLLSQRAAVDAASSRLKMAGERVRAAEQAAEAAEAAVQTAQLNLRRQEALHKNGLASRRALELAQLESVKTRTDLDRARAALSAARSEQDALRDDVEKVRRDADAGINSARASRASAQSEIASQHAALTRIEGRLSRQSFQSVKAPKDGTIMRVIANQGGEMVKAGDVLAVLVPDTKDRAVELWVDGNDAPLISRGREVRLQFEGWPAVQFSGWPSVAVGTFGGTVAVVDPADDGRGRFRVLVLPLEGAPWPDGQWLRQGTRANGWIFLNRVTLAFELWRQLNGFPPALPGPGGSDSKGMK